VHNGNDEVNESEPIVVEEPKKEVKLYGFSWWLSDFLKHVFRYLQDKVSDKIDEDQALAPEIIAE
jgi:hypothetical protein